jgi:hypothetical protein
MADEYKRKIGGVDCTVVVHSGEIPFQLEASLLGLDSFTLERMKHKRMNLLDIACARGSFVEDLRSKGIDAYGMSPTAPQKPYFFQRAITGIGSDEKIPSPDNFYSHITSFQNDFLFALQMNSQNNEQISKLKEMSPNSQKIMEGLKLEAASTFFEIGRTLKQGCRATIYPYSSAVIPFAKKMYATKSGDRLSVYTVQ